MPQHIRLSFVLEGVSAIVELLEDMAPQTCRAVCNALPVAGVAHHAVYSGSEAVLLLPTCLRVPPENATSDVAPGDVGFAWFAAGSAYGVEQDFAEVCWFYDRDARPSMAAGPVPVSLFGRIVGESARFFAVSRRMRREGALPFAIERVEPDAGHNPAAVPPMGIAHAELHHPVPAVPLVHRAVSARGALLLACSEEGGSACHVLRSRDDGASWEVGPVIVRARPALAPVTSPCLHRLPSGRLLAAFGAGVPPSLHLNFSQDDGETWGQPEATGLPGQHPHVTSLEDGRLHMVYERPEPDGGIAGAVSGDGGRSWHSFTLSRPEDGPCYRPFAVPSDNGRVFCAYRSQGGPGPHTLCLASYRP